MLIALLEPSVPSSPPFPPSLLPPTLNEISKSNVVDDIWSPPTAPHLPPPPPPQEISKSNVVDDMVSSNSLLYKPGEHPDHVVVIK